MIGGRSASAGADPELQRVFARTERQCATPGAATALIRMAAAIDVSPILGAVSVPTLVLHRTDDPSLGVAGARALADGIPGARYVELAGIDHVPWFGDSEAVLGEIEEFLTGERHRPPGERVLATVLFADIVGSTEHAAARGDSAGGRCWTASTSSRGARSPASRGGRSTAAATTSSRRSTARPAPCAARSPSRRRCGPLGVEVRAGVHTGEIELRGEDIGGIAVHIGARVCALAAAGEVLATRTVRDLTVGSELRFSDRGDHVLKGVPEPVRIYRVEG